MKKILLILVTILLSVSGAWAENITVNASDRIKNLGGKYYTIHFRFTDGNTYPVIVDNSTLKCSASTTATPAVFYFSLADEYNCYKLKETSTNRYWDFDHSLVAESSSVRIQVFPGQESGTYRICGLTTGQNDNKNNRTYAAQANGGTIDHYTSVWNGLNAETGTVTYQIAEHAGTYCTEVVLTEVGNPTFTETPSLTSGWYQVRIADAKRNLTDKYITTMDNEIAGHPATSAALGTNKGSTMLYIEVADDVLNNNSESTGKWIYVRDSKGRYMTRSAESSVTKPSDKICAIYFTSSAKTQLVLTSARQGESRQSWKALDNYIGLGDKNEYPVFYACKAGEAYSGNAYTVNFVGGSDGSKTVTYNGTETHYGFNTVYDQGTFFFAQGVTPDAGDFTFDRGTDTDDTEITVDATTKTINVLPSNVYIGENKTVTSTEWNTRDYWSTGQIWGGNGPGTTDSGMWNPIYLNGVTASGISFEGWKLRLILANSQLTASTNKLQSADGDNVTIDIDQASKLHLTLKTPTAEGGGNDPGTHTFNINGRMTIKTVSGHFAGSSTNTVNLGTTGSFTFEADNSQTIGSGASFTINAKLTEPTELNTVQSRTLATFTNVTLTPSSLTVSISGTEGWTQVDSKDALTAQTTEGKFYYIEKGESFGAILHTYKQAAYTVDTDTKFSDIYNDANFKDYIYIYIPSGKKLVLDTTLEDKGLASTPLFKAESGTSQIQIDNGMTLYTENIIPGQNPTIIGSGTFQTTDYTVTTPLKVTLGNDWTGIVARADVNVSDNGAFSFDNLVNSNKSKVQMTNVEGWIAGNSTTNANIILINGTDDYGFCVNGANNENTYTFTGNFSGSGDFMYKQYDEGTRYPTYSFTGDLSGWTGKFNLRENGTGTTTVNVTGTGRINAGFLNSSAKANTLRLTFDCSSAQDINGAIAKSGSGRLDMILKGTGTKTIAADITADNLTIVNANGAEITISGNHTLSVGNLNAYTDDNNTLSRLNVNMTTEDIAAKLGEGETCTLIYVSGSLNANALTINGHENVTVGDYDYYISHSGNAIVLGRRYYSRNVTSGNFGSICIPNGALVSQATGMAKVLEVTEVTADRVILDEVSEMASGVPYIFKSDAGTVRLTLKGETAAAPDNSTQDYLVGNFETPVSVPVSDAGNTYYVLQSNQFRKVTSQTIKSGSNRCYLKVPVTSDSRQSVLGISVGEEDATGIDALNTLMDGNAVIYDINGRRRSDLHKGINIINGIKVIVK